MELTIAFAFRIEGDKVTRMRQFLTKEDALHAVGRGD